MSSDNQVKVKKPRSYYVDYTQKGRGDRKYNATNNGGSQNSRYRDTPDISFGLTGFVLTSIDEVKSYLEMRNIFEECFEQLYPATNQSGETSTQNSRSTDDELESELRQLRRNKPFKQVKTHCRNTLFITITKGFEHLNPIAIVDRLFEDLLEQKTCRTSNTFKVLPILDTFRCNVTCAKQSISNLLQTKFKHEVQPKKFFIELQTRGNYKLNPDEKQKMIEGVAEAVNEIKPDWTVDRDNVDFMIVLVALKNVCCVTILRDYFKRSKYNVAEICKSDLHCNSQMLRGETVAPE